MAIIHVDPVSSVCPKHWCHSCRFPGSLAEATESIFVMPVHICLCWRVKNAGGDQHAVSETHNEHGRNNVWKVIKQVAASGAGLASS